MRTTARLAWQSRSDPTPRAVAATLDHVEIVGDATGEPTTGILAHGDNLRGMHALLAEGYAGAVNLAYLDPPFVSRAQYTQTVGLPNGQMVARPVFNDAWPSLDAWLDMLHPRLRLVHALLADTGSLYLHLDWRATHYARILLDEIFGPAGFRNEIVWKRAALLGRKAASGQYGRVTDTLLFYTKSDQFTFNKLSLERTVDRRQARWDAERGQWYRTAPPGDYTEASLQQLAAEGRIHATRSGRRRIKYFLTETPDGRLVDQAPLDNLWLDIPDMMHLPPSERTGYPTQKPLALLQRIVQVSSNPGELVLDAFAGGGTTLVAAASLGRRWIGLEASAAGIAVARSRLLEAGHRGFTLKQVEAATRSQGDKEGGGQGHCGETETPEFRLEPAGDQHWRIRLVSDPSQIEYWAIDAVYTGEFRSTWQGWRGYGRPPTFVPTEAPVTQLTKPFPLAVRWETLDAQSDLLIMSPFET